MPLRRAFLIFLAAGALSSCSQPKTAEPSAKLTVAAAANLTDVFGDVAKAFHDKTGVEMVFSYGSSAQLSQQIENGAPFDVFAAADVEHIDDLVVKQKLTRDSRAIYARGQLAMWIPKDAAIHELKDLTSKSVRYIAVAQPELAPYGAATVESLKNAHLWDAVQPKVVYANSIGTAKQLASTGNADVAFTAYSLVLHESGTVLKVDPAMYTAIDQALGIVAGSKQAEKAQQFRTFLLGNDGRAILEKAGYLLP